LAEAGVDDLHAGVAEGAGDDFCAAVVAVEAGFGYEDADWDISHAVVSIRVCFKWMHLGFPFGFIAALIHRLAYCRSFSSESQ
jgi:hypothetical protein